MPSEPWIVKNQEKDSLGGLQDACLATDGSFSAHADPEHPGKFLASCTYSIPETITSSNNVPAASSEGGATVPISVSTRDLDALQRVAASEVKHFHIYGAAQLNGGLAGVVDTVLNRVAHKGYPRTIQGVINQDRQFSAINGLAGWHELPMANSTVAASVKDHVIARASGQASAIKGATNFLNPYKSSSTAMANWGGFVKDNPTAIWGSDPNEDVHYHGYPPHGTQPLSYSIEYEGALFAFDPTGTKAASPASTHATVPGGLAANIVGICNAELTEFENGAAKESHNPQYLRVGDYWSTVGKSYNGRTVRLDEDGDPYNPPWSAVFVSFVLRNAGASAFPAHAAHARYFQHFVQLTNSNLYRAVSQRAETPEVGDILHYGRGYAKRFDFAQAQAKFGEDGSYISHSDIVVDIDLANKKLTTVGGNVGNSVKEKTVLLDANNKLLDRREKGKDYPWIGILKLQ